MQEMHCQTPPISVYKTLMHTLHILDVPLYLIVIIALFKIKSNIFQTYKYYLIWHTIINVLTEFHSCFLMLPVVHLPYPLLRATGILAEFGFSGLFLFYVLSAFIIQTSFSIIEMFYFRYKASVFDYQSRNFTKFVKLFIYSFRVLTILFPGITFGTFFYSIERQEEYKKELAMIDPSIPEVTCYSSVLAAPFSDSVMISTMITWLACIICAFSVIPSTTIYLNSHLRSTKNMSPGVVRMQKMLLSSLIVQTFVHGFMLGIPNILFVYTIFFGAHLEVAAYAAFMCLTFHGFLSTIAMIMYTKPIHIAILETFQRFCSSLKNIIGCLKPQNQFH
ncbi:Serpentine Receptor, class H [Caenorhabditis elegans]|uniref:Serpentine Receptor, class H n=1 Tax=Caenorhabditis elegans TaxID=6239 RepID=Q20814_CAEEL|nr:Serpentine Receptor, class H [Caenorhabditis elegans]CAB01574.2 Serpentine Receptor, class H [Caenorhabditis elegans]|eukprot:NP_506084.2 Serpentine Receptor, class H [Caenorhabditis elegans]